MVHGRPQTPKNTSFFGSPSPQGSHSLYILRDTTRPGHVTYVLVWSKSDQRRLRKTLHKQTGKQTDKQTDRHYENNGHLAVNQKRSRAVIINKWGTVRIRTFSDYQKQQLEQELVQGIYFGQCCFFHRTVEHQHGLQTVSGFCPKVTLCLLFLNSSSSSMLVSRVIIWVIDHLACYGETLFRGQIAFLSSAIQAREESPNIALSVSTHISICR